MLKQVVKRCCEDKKYPLHSHWWTLISSLLFLVKLYSSVEIKFLKLDAKMFDGTVRVEMNEDSLVEYLALPFF